MRWLLLFSGCAVQALALAWLYRTGWFSGTAATPWRGPLPLFACGVCAVLLFALWERHFVLALGQAVAVALCLLGGTPSLSKRASNHRRAGRP